MDSFDRTTFRKLINDVHLNETLKLPKVILRWWSGLHLESHPFVSLFAQNRLVPAVLLIPLADGLDHGVEELELFHVLAEEKYTSRQSFSSSVSVIFGSRLVGFVRNSLIFVWVMRSKSDWFRLDEQKGDG